MTTAPHPMLDLLDLEHIERDRYRGPSPVTRFQRIFGGQVAAQAVIAAGRTVEGDRTLHSVHGYFLRPGTVEVPVFYSVHRIRDGRAFSTRRVVAQQDGRPIFSLSASFHVPETGLEHQASMPLSYQPEDIGDAHVDTDLRDRWLAEWPSWELKLVPADALDPHRVGHTQVWLRVRDRLPDDHLVHACALAYASDMTLIATVVKPHGLPPVGHGYMIASLDHAMWFHRPFRADDWLLYDQEAPTGSGARGLATGRIFTRDGHLVATVVQEGLLRLPG